MDSQRLARLIDGRPAPSIGTGTAAPLSAVRSISEPTQTVEARGVLVTRSTSRGVCRTVPVPLTDDAPATAAGPLAALDVPPVVLPGEDGDDAAAEDAAGPSRGGRRRLSVPRRRPALYLAAALLAATGLGLVAAGPLTAQAAPAAGSTSVAEELALHRAADSALTEGEATTRLQEMVASRAEREDAQAAAAQAQAAADKAAADAAAAAAAAAAQAAAEAARPKAVLPIAGAEMTSGFGPRWGTLHAGLDFAAPLGTPEYAAMDGVVLKAGAASGFGLAVYIQHADGDVTVYGHMDQILVQEGQTVRAGDTIALLGNRGQSTGPHLHFEVHVGGMDGQKVDPLPWLRGHGVAV